MTSFKKWTRAVAVAIVFLVGAVAIVNILVDANGIFRKDVKYRFQPPNLSYVKVNYLLENKTRFDSFLFGSSRVGSIDVTKIPGGRYYNLFCPGGLPEEHLQHIRFLLKSSVPIRNIMIGLDDFSYQVDPRSHLPDLDLEPHPKVSGKNSFTFYAEHVFRLKRLVPQVKAYIKYNQRLQAHSVNLNDFFDLTGTGTMICSNCDSDIERNVKAHISSARFLEPAQYRIVLEDRTAVTLQSLKEIVNLAKQNNIHLIVFLNPLHKLTYLNTDLDLFARFKKGLAEFTRYYDFTGLNSITTNNYYYYETSHYRRPVGDMMLKVMLGTPEISVPDDFGFLVTRENIDAHVQKQCSELDRVVIGLNTTNTSYAASCRKRP